MANEFLKLTQTMSITDLQKKNPTVEDTARIAIILASVMDELSEDNHADNRVSLNGLQAALHMKQIAIAIRNNDEEALDLAVKQLESISFI